MPKKRNRFSGVLPYVFFILSAITLVADAKLCKDAVQHGITLCLQTIIPSLYPFMLLSRWVIDTDIPKQAASWLGKSVQSIFHCSAQSAICVILGFLGGYPIGAQAVALVYKEGNITKDEAEHLLSFCNNASPAFFFGILTGLLGSIRVSFILYIIHIISALLCGVFLRPKKKPESTIKTRQTMKAGKTGNILFGSIKSLATVCAYILLFQIVVRLINKYIDLPTVCSVIITGLLELSTGCLSLERLDSLKLAYCIASALLSFGGICVWLQTKSMILAVGLQGKQYLWGKILQALISIVLTAGAVFLFPVWLPSTQETLYLPNHSGLMHTMLWVIGIFLLIFVIWCLILRKKTGNKNIYGV